MSKTTYRSIVCCVIWVAAMASSYGIPQALPSHKSAEDARVVARRPASSPGGAETLSVDVDGRIILTSSWGVRILGYQAVTPPRFGSRPQIPTDQVVTSVRSLTSERGKWIVWAALSVGLSPKGYLSETTNTLFVFRDEGEKNQVLLKEMFPEVTDFVLADVNGDEATEIVIQSMEDSAISPSTYLKIWQITPEGSLRPVSLDNVQRDFDQVPEARRSVMELGDYLHGNPGLDTTQEVAETNGIRTIYRSYKWDTSTRVYKLVGTSATLETDVK